MRWRVILNEWLAIYSAFFEYSPKWCAYTIVWYRYDVITANVASFRSSAVKISFLLLLFLTARSLAACSLTLAVLCRGTTTTKPKSTQPNCAHTSRYTHTHTHTLPRTHAHTHVCIHTHTHASVLQTTQIFVVWNTFGSFG